MYNSYINEMNSISSEIKNIQIEADVDSSDSSSSSSLDSSESSSSLASITSLSDFENFFDSDMETNLETDMLTFSISNWIDLFKDVMIDTHLLEVPNELIELLYTDDSVNKILEKNSLKAFITDLETCIKDVGGVAFIRSNWRAPTDAAVFSLNYLLKVTNVTDALNYVDYSNYLLSDFEKCKTKIPVYFAIRPWIDIHPSSEFRCIVVHGDLIGITPRDWPHYYAYYIESYHNIIKTIKEFFEAHMQKFLQNNYVFDIYIPNEFECLLWDISPLNKSTILHAFSWKEIEEIIKMPHVSRNIVFRFLAEETGILPKNLPYVIS